MDLIIVGRPNVGKTLLMINFAAYLGMREIRVQAADAESAARTQRLSLDRARRDLVSLHAPKTTELQCIPVELTLGRQRLATNVIDTPGVTEGVSEVAWERRQTALTLERLMTATVVLHVVDASAVRTRRLEAPGAFDSALTTYGNTMGAYLLVANKMDRPGSNEGLKTLKDRHHGISTIPVSCMTRRGFRDLKVWLMRTLA